MQPICQTKTALSVHMPITELICPILDRHPTFKAIKTQTQPQFVWTTCPITIMQWCRVVPIRLPWIAMVLTLPSRVACSRQLNCPLTSWMHTSWLTDLKTRNLVMDGKTIELRRHLMVKSEDGLFHRSKCENKVLLSTTREEKRWKIEMRGKLRGTDEKIAENLHLTNKLT